MRDHQINIRLDKDELFMLQQLADEAGLSLSAYLRRCGTRRKISSTIDRQALGDLLKVNASLAREGNMMKLAITEFSDATGERAVQLIEKAHENAMKLLAAKKLLFEKIEKIESVK